MRRQVERAQQIQRERFAGSGICYNSQIPPGEIAVYCKTSEGAEKMLQGAFESLHLSGRACNRILRVARTAADLDGKERIEEEEIAEAIGLPLAVYLLAIWIMALASTRSIKIATLAVPASIIQLGGYGTGFLKAYFNKIILGKGRNIEEEVMMRKGK